MFKHLGLISIIIMWTGTYVLLNNHIPDAGKTISRHASRSVRYHIMYGILEVAVVSMFAAFMFGWFIHTFELGRDYAIVAILGFIGTVIAAAIPDHEGWQRKVHGLGAYGMAFSLLVMNLLLLTSPKIHLLTSALLYISLACMIVCMSIALFRPKLYNKNALIIQIIYFSAFHIPLLSAIYG